MNKWAYILIVLNTNELIKMINFCFIKSLHSVTFFSSLILCMSHMYIRKNRNVCWFMLRVIYAYLESHEKTCSHTSVSTYIMCDERA